MPRSPRTNLALENAHRSGGSLSHPLVSIKAIGDYLAEGAIAVDAQRLITYANRTAAGLLGVPPEALVGRDVLSVAGRAHTESSPFARALTEVLERRVAQVLTVNDADTEAAFNVDYCRLFPVADGGAIILLGEMASTSVVEQLSKSQLLATMLQSINQSLEVERVVDLIAAHAAALVGCATARLVTIDDGELVTVACFGLPASATGRRQQIDESIAARAIRSLCLARVDSLAGLDDCSDIELAIPTATAAPVAALVAPLLIGNRPIGAMIVTPRAARPFSNADEQLLVTLATHGAIALENAKLYRAAAQTARHAEAAARIARVALASLNPADAADSILTILGDVVPLDGAAIGLLDRDDTITYVAATGTSRWALDTLVPLGASVTQDVLPRASDRAESAGDDGARDEALARGGVVVPLTAKRRLLGVLTATAPAGHVLPPSTVEALRRLGPSVALAIDVQLLGEGKRHQHERERMLATALATMDQPVFVLSLDRRVLYANDAAVREYGYSLDELTTMTVDVLVASAVPLRASDDVSRTPAHVVVAEHVHRRRDGSQFPATVALSFIRQDSGAAIGQVLSVRNLTEERRIAEQLRQSEKLAALGELVAGVAHELNNPLAGISAFAQLLLEEEVLTDDQRESARLIKREADRAVSVIRDLLLFSRKAGPTTAPVDLNGLIQLTLRLRTYSLRSSGVEVETHLDPSLPEIPGDDQKLQQVILNLIVNAEYAMRRMTTKRLVIRTSVEDDAVVAEVSDTGSGMSEETVQRVFEPFFTTKPAGEGTGLGLSVSYGIIEAHGGTIAVESALGRGTTFRIVLPTPLAYALPRGRSA